MTDAWPMIALLGLSVVALLVVVRTGTIRTEQATTRRAVELHGRAELAAARHAPVAGAAAVTFSPHVVYSPQTHEAITQAPGLPALPVGAAALPELPGVCDLGSVLAGGWRPSPQSILLGLGPGGRLLTTATGDSLCHLAFAGVTGVGKTNLTRLFTTQLIAAGCAVWLLDTKYTPRHPLTGLEWTAIAARTVPGRALIAPEEILATLRQMAEVELPARKARFNVGAHPGRPLFLFVEEVPYLAGLEPRLMDWLGTILRLGRELGVFLAIALQDALISTIGGNSGDRAQLQTCYYGGGDPTTAKALLRLPKAPPDPPGKGVVLLRSAATPVAELVRVPLVTNSDIAALLGDPVPVSAASPASAPVSGLMPWGGGETGSETGGGDPAKREAVRLALRAREPYGAIVERVWHVTAGGGAGYKTACKEMAGIVAELVGEG